MTGPTGREGTSSTAIAGGRLWAGGFATALVAALVAVVGVLISRGVFGIPVLAPEGRGVWGDADTGWYAAFGALAALVSTALLHLLLLFAPRPLQFFHWIIALATLVGAFVPLAIGVSAATIATALINLCLGLTIGILLSAVARSAVRSDRRV